MKIEKTFIPDLLVIHPDVFPDSRGYFFESFNQKRYGEAGLKLQFVQDNISRSIKNTIRGLHYQIGEYAQGKLCQVIAGTALDVAVDIRWNSPTFGKYFSILLSEENHTQLWIPPGFAHGFAVLSEYVIFHYKCTSFYSKAHERGIRYNDPDIAIKWQVDNPIVSEKDRNLIYFNQIKKDFIFNGGEK